jgi:hypothetical protein
MAHNRQAESEPAPALPFWRRSLAVPLEKVRQELRINAFSGILNNNRHERIFPVQFDIYTTAFGIGALTIKADGTYVWKATAKDSTSGKWRKATKEEMKDQGGDGIVLLKAKGGEDWIVMHDRWTKLKGNWINIHQLNWRQIKERGWRGGK